MKARKKYAQDRHQPEGEWVQTTVIEKVVGLKYRKQDALAFSRAARKAENQDCIYGVRLEPEPDNPIDQNAIKVWGFAESKNWLGGNRQAEWHIGYLSAELAAELHRDLISIGVPIAAELCNIFEDDGCLEINLLVLAPQGFGNASRYRTIRKREGLFESRVEKASRLVFEGKFDEVINFLLDCCDGEEALSEASGQDVSPWCYESLAKLFRKLKFAEEEITILTRYKRHMSLLQEARFLNNSVALGALSATTNGTVAMINS